MDDKNEVEVRERSESVLTEVPAEHVAVTSTPAPSSTSPTTATTTSLPPISDRLKVFTDVAFRFIANASNETLGACAVGLAASTYLVLGRLGLVLIGAFGGVLLHATWESSSTDIRDGSVPDSASKRRELGAEIVKRALDWRSEHKSDLSLASEGKVEASTIAQPLDYSEYQPETAAALNEFTDAVVRDYVNWWYAPVLPKEKSFPASCRQTLVAFIHSLSNHLSRKRAADPFLDFLANSTSIVIVFLNELSSALKASQKQEPEHALRTYLKYQPDSNLANVISAEQQSRKLEMVADDILQNFLDSKTYNCVPARNFLREVLSTLILQSTVNTCAKPEWINGWIVYLLEDGEPEIMKEIDAGVEDLGDKMKKAGASKATEQRSHQRRMSRAEEAMQEAMREAQRMNDMIAEEDARRMAGTLSRQSESELSTATTDAGIATPTSSDSAEKSNEDSFVFDSEGNPHPSPIKNVEAPAPSFTTFDQLEIAQPPAPPQTTSEPPPPSEVMLAVPLTLHNASVNIMDIGESNDQIPMKQRPNDSMLIQIEPASSKFPGWMVTKQYAGFEPLHETLRRIAVISGVPEFTNKYPALPLWKNKTRAALVYDLELYLKTALASDRLAECDAMKRFLEKETGLEKMPSKNVLAQGGQALENVGKGFVNVLGQGGKGIQTGFQTGGKAFQTGGKAVLGGVAGVFGAVTGNNASPGNVKRPGAPPRNTTLSQTNLGSPIDESKRISQDLPRMSSETSTSTRPGAKSLTSARASMEVSCSSQDLLSRPSMSTLESEERLHLPPPPDQITDEYEPVKQSSRPQSTHSTSSRPVTPKRSSSRLNIAADSSTAELPSRPPLPSRTPSQTPAKASPRKSNLNTPLTEEETRITLDLMFAILTDLLSLSTSAWTFRISLLSAAKSYLMRPANPQLESIRTLLQESVIDANLTSDTGLAEHIKKLRFNTLPTQEELELPVWKDAAKEMSQEDKDKLRAKARKLLVERGMPTALVAVVGSGACGEALGRVFDCLQVEEIARGLIFALMLQAVRAATQ